MRDAEHVRVDRDALDDAEARVHDDVSRLASDAGKFLQVGVVAWHFAPEIGEDHLRAFDAVRSFHAEETDGAQDFFHVRHIGGTTTLLPIGHHQVDGDYRESWQPQPMSETALEQARKIAITITGALGGRGIFGVEMFVKGDKVIFSEVSPRPHDTGMVTMVSQDLSEFALHARAILGLPIPAIRFFGPSASKAIVIEGDTDTVRFSGLEDILAEEDVHIRLFGKPEVRGHRRFGVLLARDESVEKALAKVERAYAKLKVDILPREK